MHSHTVLCSRCQSKKEQLERGGAIRVISCKPIAGQENKPADRRECTIIFEVTQI